MRIIIAGGRDFEDYDLLCRACEYYFSRLEGFTIITGGARGADALGRRYAEENDIPHITYRADWSKGPKAGPLRNKQMALNGDALLAFWDGKSKGTSNMINEADRLGLDIRIVRYDKKRE